MAKEPKSLSFDEFAEELLLEEQPRAIVILAAAKVDTQLRSIIEAYLLPKKGDAKAQDDLLDGDNPLATFSSRIKMCLRAGLIDERLARALDKLRGIRNQAAHWISFGISDAPLNDQVKSLNSVVGTRRSYALTVSRFFGQEPMQAHDHLKATLLTLSVLLESIRVKIEADPNRRVSPAPSID